ncbi:MAG: cobalamin biosynthesis protein, partial [bacterium]
VTRSSLVVGFGCERGIKSEAVEKGIKSILEQYSRSVDGVRFIASIDLKSDEEGLLDAAGSMDVDLQFYDVERLRMVTPPNPNPVVKDAVGVPGVAESAALTAVSAETLLCEKTVLHPCEKGMTVALAEHTGTDRPAERK